VLLLLPENRRILKGLENQVLFGLNFLMMIIPPTIKAMPIRLWKIEIIIAKPDIELSKLN